MCFNELLDIPFAEREAPDIVGRMHVVNRGLNGAAMPIGHLVGGVFRPKALGIVQLHGTSANAWDRDNAVRRARVNQDVPASCLRRAFPHIRTAPPDRECFGLVTAHMSNLPGLAICVGCPEPEAARKRRYGQDDSIGRSGDAYGEPVTRHRLATAPAGLACLADTGLGEARQVLNQCTVEG